MKAKATKRRYARLTFADGEVVVTPRDRDTFLISAEKAIEACHNAIQADNRIGWFESEFLMPLHEWCLEHSGRVQACYIPSPRGHIQVFIVTKSPQFDFELAKEIAALELRLAKAGWMIGVHQLPEADPDSLSTFFHPEGALEVYAQGERASKKSGT